MVKNLKPGRSNFSIYINEEDREFFIIFKLFCDQELSIALSSVVLRAMRFWIAHLPNHMMERWRKATKDHFEREHHRIRQMTKIIQASARK